MANLGIRFRGEVLVDDLDARRDLRGVPGLELRVRSTVLAALPPPGTPALGDRAHEPGAGDAGEKNQWYISVTVDITITQRISPCPSMPPAFA